MKRMIVHSVGILLLIVMMSACGNITSNSSTQDQDTMRSELRGTVTAIDSNRVLIVSKDANHPENKTPTAVWVDLVDVSLKDVQIGNQVKVETDGMMLESYPMQTKGYKLEVMSAVNGKGDLEGTVTAVALEGNSDIGPTIEVDGINYSLLPFAKYWVNTVIAEVKDIKIGDKVELWFPGYQVFEERLVTQVRIVR
jgi:hypothetical protein